jgi:hypothetical protein
MLRFFCEFFLHFIFTLAQKSQENCNLFSRKLLRRENLRGVCGALRSAKRPQIFAPKLFFVKMSCDYFAIAKISCGYFSAILLQFCCDCVAI